MVIRLSGKGASALLNFVVISFPRHWRLLYPQAPCFCVDALITGIFAAVALSVDKSGRVGWFARIHQHVCCRCNKGFGKGFGIVLPASIWVFPCRRDANLHRPVFFVGGYTIVARMRRISVVVVYV